MIISRAAKYGLFAMGYIAKNSKDGLVTIVSIAKEYGIPDLYLAKSIRLLVRNNILKSKKGIGGGYSLARPAKEISMLEIIEIIDGPLDRMIETTQYDKDTPFVVNMEKTCKDTIEEIKSRFHKAKISKMIK